VSFLQIRATVDANIGRGIEYVLLEMNHCLSSWGIFKNGFAEATKGSCPTQAFLLFSLACFALLPGDERITAWDGR
jgi:hypothetical protein